MKQMSLRQFVVYTELFSSLVLLAFIVAGIFVSMKKINQIYINYRKLEVEKTALFVDQYVETAKLEFAHFLELNDKKSPPVRKHLKSLSDVYFVDSTLRVREIFKSQKNSRVFINFKIAKSFKQFLHNAQSNSVQVSSVVFSLESGAPAIYFLSENSNGFYLAQLDLASIAKKCVIQTF